MAHRSHDAALALLDDADRVAVRRMFEVLRDAAEELAPSLQIIGFDHAKLSDEWFAESIVEEWRGGLRAGA